MKSQTNTMNPGMASPSATHVPDRVEAFGDRDEQIARPLPAVSRQLLRWFTWYSRRYIARHFHSLRVSKADLPFVRSDLPLVAFTNHASWWDPLVGLVLKHEFYPERTAFMPIDAAALNRYKIFGKLGFFGVEQDNRRGAAQFLRAAESILTNSSSLLALTPQGKFGDVRERPVQFRPGLGHLAARVEHAQFLPMAVEYVFWEERLPEILVRFGPVIEVRGNGSTTPRYWTAIFEEKLSAAQDALAIDAKNRKSDDFQFILRGGAGQGGVYDWWRGLRFKMHGEIFQKEHGTK